MPKLFRFVCVLILLALIVVVFLPGFQELWQTYTRFWLFDNALAAAVILLGFGGLLLSHIKKNWPFDFAKNFKNVWALGLLIIACAGLVTNNALSGFQVVPPILCYLIVYAWLGLVVTPAFWKKSFPVCLLLILTLPILERLQRFIGFPLQIFTAKVVSVLLQFLGANHVSASTIILTENYATTIDIPCSGIKSLYFGVVIMLGGFFLQQLRLSWKSLLLALSFLSLLIFFNTWRVFALVYVYGVLHLQQAGDAIHVSLGVVGFGVSCFLLWLGASIVSKDQPPLQKKVKPSSLPRLQVISSLIHHLSFWQFFLFWISILLFTAVATQVFFPLRPKPVQQHSNLTFELAGTVLTPLPFTAKEETLFAHPEISFAQKYVVEWQAQKQISLLLVKSNSARSYHDPELCLQSLGYRLLKNEVELVNSQPIKHLEVTTVDGTNQSGSVYYWYVSRQKMITDYSQRIWAQLEQPTAEWVLIEVALKDSPRLTQPQLEQLFGTITESVRQQLL
jgi:exosortase O